MKRMELDFPGSVGLGVQEMKKIEGGVKVPAAAWWAVIWDAFNNFGDIREGISDGASGKPPRY